jgi:hypothetical protein
MATPGKGIIDVYKPVGGHQWRSGGAVTAESSRLRLSEWLERVVFRRDDVSYRRLI